MGRQDLDRTGHPQPSRLRHQRRQSVSLNAASCGSGTACTAIGDYAPDGQPTAFAEVWNGTAPAGAIATVISGVWCNRWRCTAVGDYDTLAGAEVTLAMTTSHRGAEFTTKW